MNYIYCITNTFNNKRYVGKTTGSIQKRFKEHCNDAFNNKETPLHRAIRKYGTGGFIIETLEEVEDENNLSEREIYWIKELETYGTNGYNATKGGDGTILYDYTEIVDLYNLGYSTTQISEKIGCDIHTVSNVLKSKGIKNRGKSKLIEQYDLDGNFIRVFNGSREAAEYILENNLSSAKIIKNTQQGINKCCSGRQLSAFGFIWKYVNVK